MQPTDGNLSGAGTCNRIKVMPLKEDGKGEVAEIESPSAKMVDNDPNIAKLWTEFLRDTSLHGFKNVENRRKHWLER